MKKICKINKRTSLIIITAVIVSISTSIGTVTAEYPFLIIQEELPRMDQSISGSDVVWDNGQPSYGGMISQYDKEYPNYNYVFNAQAADDFRFDVTTEVTGVGWWGIFAPPGYEENPCDFTIYIYADDGTGYAPTGGGMDDPETTVLAVYEFEDVFGEHIVGCSFFYEVQFQSSFSAQHDVKYWMVIQADLTYKPYWGWYITDNPMQLSPSVYGFMEYADGNTYHPYYPISFWTSSVEYSNAFYLLGNTGGLEDDEIDQNQSAQTDDSCYAIGYIQDETIFQVAQSFIPTKTTLTRVEVLISRFVTATAPLNLAIRDGLTHENLVETSVPTSGIPTDPFSWIEFDFEDLSVTPGETYYIIAYTTDNSDTLYKWAMNTSPDSYPQGSAWVSMDNGNTWDQLSSDMCFKTYGIQQTTLEVEHIKGGIGIDAAIQNNGTIAATNVEVTLTISGGFSQQINISKSSFALALDVNEIETLRSGLFFGFGPIDIEVNATADNAPSVTEKTIGFIIGSYALLWTEAIT